MKSFGDKINKIALFTDIHFGRKNNSELHNQDCERFVLWFIDQIKSDPTIDAVGFLGDWHEHRSAVNGLTLHYSNKCAKLLSELGVPVFFIVGNHDLYYRNNRDIFTTIFMENLPNFVIVDEPVHLTENKCVFTPFIFENEYPEFFSTNSDIEIFMGHFEFKGFVLTGETKIKEHGPDPEDYKSAKRIFSGHYHKRQIKDNIVYIGNAFPADFSDANDSNRGMAVYDFNTNHLEFRNWDQCPTYIKTKVSSIMENPKSSLKLGARVNAILDEDMSIEEVLKFKELLISKYKLRELNLEELPIVQPELSDVEKEIEELDLQTTDDIIVELLKRIESKEINADILVKEFRNL